MSTEKYKGLAALLIYIALGAIVNPALVRFGLKTINPFILLFLRQVITFVIVLPILLRNKKQLSDIKTLKMLFISSLFFGANILFFTFGISRTTIFSSQLIYATLPLTVSVASFFLLKERFSYQRVLGICLSMLGLGILLFSSRQADNATGSLIGNLFFVAAVITYTFYIIFSKKFSKKYSSLFISAATYSFLPIIYLPFGIYGLTTTPSIFSASAISLVSLLGIGIFSFVMIAFMQYSVSKLSSVTVALGSLLSPELAAIAGFFLFNEKINLAVIFSTVFVIGGLIMSIFEKKTIWQRILAKLKLSTN